MLRAQGPEHRKRFVVVSPGSSLAEAAAHLVEGAPESKHLGELVADGKVVGLLPDVRFLLKALADPSALTPIGRSLKAHLERQMDLEVEAFYCPPVYFVRFTGRRRGRQRRPASPAISKVCSAQNNPAEQKNRNRRTSERPPKDSALQAKHRESKKTTIT